MIHDRKYPLVQIVTAIRTEQPPLVTQKRATKTGGGVSRHVKRRASRDSGSVVDGLLNSSLDSGRQIVDACLPVHFVRSRLRHHVHIHSADGDGGRRVVGYDLKFVERIVVRVELRVATIRPRPIQVQTVEAVNLLAGCAAVYLHGGLLIAVVPGHVKGGQSCSRYLRDGGPGVPPAWNVLQQTPVKCCRGLIALQVDHRLAFNLNNLSDFANLQLGIDRRRETRSEDDPGLTIRAESRRSNSQLIRARRKQVKQIASVRLRVRASESQERSAFD